MTSHLAVVTAPARGRAIASGDFAGAGRSRRQVARRGGARARSAGRSGLS
jgi:hypothetical protein